MTKIRGRRVQATWRMVTLASEPSTGGRHLPARKRFVAYGGRCPRRGGTVSRGRLGDRVQGNRPCRTRPVAVCCFGKDAACGMCLGTATNSIWIPGPSSSDTALVCDRYQCAWRATGSVCVESAGVGIDVPGGHRGSTDQGRVSFRSTHLILYQAPKVLSAIVPSSPRKCRTPESAFGDVIQSSPRRPQEEMDL